MTAALFVLRPGVPADHGHVYSSWLHSTEKSALAAAFRGSSPDARRAMIDALLVRAQLVVACAPDDANTILGWALVEKPNVLHYVCVKPFIRTRGLARELVAQLAQPLRFTARTALFERWHARHPTWVFDPALAFGVGR